MTKKELEDIFWRATMMCLSLDPDDPSDEVQKRVRISWPTAETGNNNWGREENVVFLRLSPGLDPFGTQHDVIQEYDAENDQGYEAVIYHRSWQIAWVCYGPDSDNDADTIRIGILRDAIRAYLRRYNVAVLPDIRDPVHVPEPDETGEWWERNDLTAQFYELVTRRYANDFIEQSPEISTTILKE